MPNIPFETPVEDSVPKVADEVAVGEDLDFQRKWWRFEKIIWPILVLIIVADVVGLFGRGWLAKAKAATPDNALSLDYERIERASTPSIMTLHFGEPAIHNGRIVLHVSDSIVKPLGAQRISPQPALSVVGNNEITYVIPATQSPASLQIEMDPSFPGLHPFRVQVEGSTPIDRNIFVVP
ncbi:hypothetical protein DYQ86_03930 [Acidobacteria bacterium AB60]|nr:hypothetical protein DYQ86_03930 [Acidobacteria bacterium AB60]